MTERKTVYFVLDYQARARVKAGEDPRSILFGADRAPEGWRVEDAPVAFARWRPRGRLLRQVIMLVRRGLGSAYQAMWIAVQVRRDPRSVVYCSSQWIAGPVLALRASRIIQSPVVVLVHGTTLSPGVTRLLKHADALMALSLEIKLSLERSGVPTRLITECHWGPDLAWPAYATQPDSAPRDVVMFGKSHRDLQSVLWAALSNGWRADLFHDGTHYEVAAGAFAKHRMPARVSGTEMVAIMKSARAVAIPVSSRAPRHALTGLTELVDAIAVETPVLMPRNADLPFDVEVQGVGVWLEASASPEEYAHALEMADTLPRGGFRHCRAQWNIERFRGEVFQVLDGCIV